MIDHLDKLHQRHPQAVISVLTLAPATMTIALGVLLLTLTDLRGLPTLGVALAVFVVLTVLIQWQLVSRLQKLFLARGGVANYGEYDFATWDPTI